jgi:undecaprenol kinase
MIKPIKLLKSFGAAFEGIKVVFKTEQNFRVQVLFGLLVFVCSIVLKINIWEWLIVIFLVLLVLLLEMLNTVFERLVDMLKPRVHMYVYDIKNITAGMVLITAVSAIIIGGIIFIPKIVNLFLK